VFLPDAKDRMSRRCTRNPATLTPFCIASDGRRQMPPAPAAMLASSSSSLWRLPPASAGSAAGKFTLSTWIECNRAYCIRCAAHVLRLYRILFRRRRAAGRNPPCDAVGGGPWISKPLQGGRKG